jgi:GNAT superfamily N-acetyltransferase
MRLASQSRLPESTTTAEDRAVQDAFGLRQGAPHRQGGGRHPHRGTASTTGAAGAWRGHLLIRQARPGEGRTLTAAYEWLFAAPGIRPADWSPNVAAHRLETTIADDRSTVLVADDNEAVVGFATVYLGIVSVRFGQRAWVEDLAVAPQRRSSGIGKALLDAAKTWARNHGAAWLALESGAARLDAHRFYEREGPDGWSRSFKWTL